MKFLQTGDLHLGKIFYDRSLIEDQAHILKAITAELAAEGAADDPYDALLVTGDVYDRSIPPPDAVTLFSSFLTEVRTVCPQLHVCIIPGNHDSARRLSFASDLLKFQNIHITGETEHSTTPVIIEKRTPHDTERAAIYCLPFLTPGCTEEGISRQQDMALESVARIIENRDASYKNIPAILCAHLFTRNGVTSDSERLFIGTAEQVSADIFKPFAYTALGHLHKCQNPADTVWYSGSPLAYSFSEAGSQKYLLRVTLKADGAAQNADPTLPQVTVTKLPLTPLRPVVKLSGTFEQFYRDADNRFTAHADSYLEISCTDRTLIENPMALLKPKYPYLLSVLQETAVGQAASASIAQRRELLRSNERGGALSKDVFTAFMNDIYSPLPDNFDEEAEIFRTTAQELNRSEI